MMARLRREDGITLVEVLVASAMSLAILGGVFGFLTVATKAERFTGSQLVSLDEARVTMQKVSRDLQSASSIGTCAAGTVLDNCAIVVAQAPNGTASTVRYERVGSELRRSVKDPGTGTFSTPEVLVQGVVNDPAAPMFTCETGATYPRVAVDLVVQSASSDDPSLTLHTTARPRNVSGQAVCP